MSLCCILYSILWSFVQIHVFIDFQGIYSSYSNLHAFFIANVVRIVLWNHVRNYIMWDSSTLCKLSPCYIRFLFILASVDLISSHTYHYSERIWFLILVVQCVFVTITENSILNETLSRYSLCERGLFIAKLTHLRFHEKLDIAANLYPSSSFHICVLYKQRCNL